MSDNEELMVKTQDPTQNEVAADNTQDSSTEHGETVTNAQQVRSSTRERTLTEKGKEMQEEMGRKYEKAFTKAYTSWTHSARGIRTALKTFCSLEDLHEIKRIIQNKHNAISEIYESIQQNCIPTPDIVKKMDTSITITSEICEIVEKHLDTLDKPFNEQLVKTRVRIALNKEDYGSVFGHTITETAISAPDDAESRNPSRGTHPFQPETPSIAKSISSNHTNVSRDSSKRADAEADLAAKQEKARALHEIHIHQAKLQEAKTKLKELKAQKDIRVAAARVQAYNNFEADSEYANNKPITNKPHSAPPYITSSDQASPKTSQAETIQTSSKTAATVNVGDLTQSLISSLSINRLPAPEPPTFSGEPLEFVDWKMSFMALIDRQPLSASEKMFYLKHYLAGEALRSVEGFFYRNSDEAYNGAWRVLKERYGNPFIVQKAFRDKLMTWPNISSDDPFALRDFSDFLQSCVEAMPYVKGLSILNDCEENHKILKKLPDWIVRGWSRVVSKELDESGDYPSFSCFTKYLKTEASIACNPIASPFLVNRRPTDEKEPRKTRAFNTSAQSNDSNSRPLFTCPICTQETHGIATCPTFARKPIEVKKSYIFENQLCFGCLRKGHSSKECKRRHTCGACGRPHPTCLHDDGDKRSILGTETGGEVAKEPTSSGDLTGREIHAATANTVLRRASATSTIVPVFLSSIEEPHREILTYALLDTQSDSSFVLEGLLGELKVDTQPVHLKLSTMTAIDSVTASINVRGLQVRGLHSKKLIQLNHAYTRNFIPADKSSIPTKNTARQWSHLKHLANQLPPLQDCEVGLLIGNDCPAALAPLEVITGDDHDPFAQRTALGWSIVGPSKPHPDQQWKRSHVNRITVKEVPNVKVTDRSPQSEECESDPDNLEEWDMSSSFVRRAKHKLEQREKGKKTVKEVTRSRHSPSPSHEATNLSMISRPSSPVHKELKVITSPKPNPAVKKDAVDDQFKPGINRTNAPKRGCNEDDVKTEWYFRRNIDCNRRSSGPYHENYQGDFGKKTFLNKIYPPKPY